MSLHPLKIIFVGTPEFACPSLLALARDTSYQICLVITQPDQPAGRGWSEKPSAVKVLSQKLNLPISQPRRISELGQQLKDLQPDLAVVVAYSQLIPSELLAIPKYGWLNLHGSRLPDYRGAGVIQAALLAGDRQASATIMLMDQNLDTGPILAAQAVEIDPQETVGSLSLKLATAGAAILSSTIKAYVAGEVQPQAQDDTQARYYRELRKQDGLIDWQQPAKNLERFIRAMSPWPTAWTWLNGRQLKITGVDPTPLPINTYKPGKTFLYNNQLAVQCGQDALLINAIKPEGKNEMPSSAFINGHRQSIGQILG